MNPKFRINDRIAIPQGINWSGKDRDHVAGQLFEQEDGVGVLLPTVTILPDDWYALICQSDHFIRGIHITSFHRGYAPGGGHYMIFPTTQEWLIVVKGFLLGAAAIGVEHLLRFRKARIEIR